MNRLPAIVIAALSLIVGCAQDQSAVDEGGPQRVDFAGAVDPKLVGAWQTASHDSVLTLDKDGALAIESNFNTPKGRQQSKKQGKWLVGDGKLRLQYHDVKGPASTVAYELHVAGNKMTLSTKIPKRDVVYTRQ